MENKVSLKLGRQDWLAVATETLVAKGIEAVRIDALARLLNVTRGSFYWHFKDRGSLLAAMLEDWETSNTKSVIERIEGAESLPNDKLMSLLEVAVEDDDRLERAVRMWSVNDSEAEKAINLVDLRRLDYLHSLFLQLGFSQIDAKVRAQIVYSVRLGWLVMTSSTQPAERLNEMRLLHAILTKPTLF